MTTPADELAAAVAQLRSCPTGHDPAVPGGAIPTGIAEPLADWLEIAKEYADRWPPDAQTNSPFRTGALAVARAINADQADPPEFAGGQHWWIHDARGIGWPGSHDRDSVVARLVELREQHPENAYRLICDTTTSTVEDA